MERPRCRRQREAGGQFRRQFRALIQHEEVVAVGSGIGRMVGAERIRPAGRGQGGGGGIHEERVGWLR